MCQNEGKGLNTGQIRAKMAPKGPLDPPKWYRTTFEVNQLRDPNPNHPTTPPVPRCETRTKRADAGPNPPRQDLRRPKPTTPTPTPTHTNPTTNHQPPTTDARHTTPNTYHPTSNHLQPSTTHRQDPTSNPQPPTSNHQPPNTNTQPPTTHSLTSRTLQPKHHTASCRCSLRGYVCSPPEP